MMQIIFLIYLLDCHEVTIKFSSTRWQMSFMQQSNSAIKFGKQ